MYNKLKYSEDTYQILDDILSGVINSSGSFDSAIIRTRENLVNKILDVVRQEECSGFYYIIFEYITRLIRLQTLNAGMSIELTENALTKYLKINIPRLIKNKHVNIELIAEELGHEINIAVDDMKAKNLLYSYCIKKFVDLREMGITLTDAIVELDSLFQSIMTDISHHSLHTSAMILEGPVYVGKESYEGSEGYIKYQGILTGILQERTSRWNNSRNNITTIETVEEYNKLNNKAKDDIYPVAKFNIEPFDEVGCIMAGDIFTLIGDEGTGKTNYMVNLTTPILADGKSVVIMCGESKKIKILNMFLSRFIYLQTGHKIHWMELLGDLSNISNNDIKAIINDCKYKLFEDPNFGKIILVQKFSYSNYYKEITDIIRQHRDKTFAMVAIDHTDKLDKGEYNATIGALKDGRLSVNALYNWILDLKMEFNLAHLLLAHTGSEAASLIAKGKEVGKRIGATSSATSKDADIVMHLESGPAFEKKKLVKAVIKKFREIDITLFKPTVLRKDFSCCNYIYTEELQAELGVAGDDRTLSLADAEISTLIDEE